MVATFAMRRDRPRAVDWMTDGRGWRAQGDPRPYVVEGGPPEHDRPLGSRSELGQAGALHERSKLLSRLRADFVRIHFRRPSITDEEFAVDEHVADGARAAAEQDACDGIAAGSVELLEVEHDEVRALALLQRADLRVDLEHLRTLARRKADGVVTAQRPDAAHHACKKRREADLLEPVEPVVARGAVGTKTDGDAGAPQPRNLSDAGAEL